MTQWGAQHQSHPNRLSLPTPQGVGARSSGPSELLLGQLPPEWKVGWGWGVQMRGTVGTGSQGVTTGHVRGDEDGCPRTVALPLCNSSRVPTLRAS